LYQVYLTYYFSFLALFLSSLSWIDGQPSGIKSTPAIKIELNIYISAGGAKNQ